MSEIKTLTINGRTYTFADEVARENASYIAMAINSLSVTPTVAELGDTVSAAVKWSLNKLPKTLAIDGVSITPATQNGTKNYESISSSKSWTLTATDDKGITASKTVTLSFYNGVYYGAVSAPASINSAFILSLTKNLRGSKLTEFTVTPGVGQYIYYCVPVRFGTCTFAIGGFNGGFANCEKVSFENASGYTEEYYVYRSDYANLGESTVTVS